MITDKEGNSYIDYAGLVPLLIKSLSSVNTRVDDLCDAIGVADSRMKTSPASIDKVESINIYLEQNTPNPCSTITTINYSLPEGATAASIMVFNLQGSLMKTYSLMEKQGHITISADEFAAGMYLYTLVANGKDIETKRMIISK